ncbi:hypothetical protein BDP55DRAFT_134298 [Colletotrichum godetiae]|uniref:Uncharacterized protein n=1 Tax=Colletotrichum godetiae TaxID=1209918 RepID=A0AAJ0AY89_9PEZI|nr:uncharacterized protein BDP55DRAFT_134298 [Colletotrichum godetiae]KAK1700506.1 hypothetical protein BDP55DRAFT_134298 [Colletotrichum godetiae]
MGRKEVGMLLAESPTGAVRFRAPKTIIAGSELCREQLDELWLRARHEGKPETEIKARLTLSQIL